MGHAWTCDRCGTTGTLHVIVDETDVLAQGEGTRWALDVPAGRTELKISHGPSPTRPPTRPR